MCLWPCCPLSCDVSCVTNTHINTHFPRHLLMNTDHPIRAEGQLRLSNWSHSRSLAARRGAGARTEPCWLSLHCTRSRFTHTHRHIVYLSLWGLSCVCFETDVLNLSIITTVYSSFLLIFIFPCTHFIHTNNSTPTNQQCVSRWAISRILCFPHQTQSFSVLMRCK